MRGEDYRYTRWIHWDNTTLAGKWDDVDFAKELYDHTGDNSTSFDAWENENIAASNPQKAQELHGVLRSFFDKQ